jgi:hypothetical protein
MKKALQRYPRPSIADTRTRSVSDTAGRRVDGLPGTANGH